jgi:hypothetical protein
MSDEIVNSDKLKDTKYILDALDGCDINIDKHNILTNLTHDKIQDIRLRVLSRLNISNEKIQDFQEKLQDYLYVDEIEQLIPGSYIRWISIYGANDNSDNSDNNDDDIILKRGAFIKTIDILQNGVYIVCMQKYKNRLFKLKIDNFFIFKKLTDDEQVILYALKYINNS